MPLQDELERYRAIQRKSAEKARNIRWDIEDRHVQTYIAACCHVGQTYHASTGDLYRAYLAWPDGGYHYSQQRLSRILQRLGYPVAKYNGCRTFFGIAPTVVTPISDNRTW